MKDFRFGNSRYNTRSSAGYDEGLRQYFLKIYSLMSWALVVTALSAFAVLAVPSLTEMMYQITPYGQIVGMTGIGWLICFAPLGISLFFAFGMHKIETQTAQVLFWVYAVLMGMSLSSLGFMYTGASLVKTFLVCAATFGGMSLYGYTTKKDLTSMGSFLYMGLIGLIIASLVNLFMQSPAIEFALSFIGVIIFTGLIAYDTQKLKSLYYSGADASSKIGIIAAFTLYLDFINLFIYLLRFMGQRRD